MDNETNVHFQPRSQEKRDDTRLDFLAQQVALAAELSSYIPVLEDNVHKLIKAVDREHWRPISFRNDLADLFEGIARSIRGKDAAGEDAYILARNLREFVYHSRRMQGRSTKGW